MRHGSLFSGIGGFDLAAEWMGWENVFHCEWNNFGQRVLKHYWPNAESFNDITKTDFTKYANKIDILTGGFPCQPYSSAGKRLGKEDERHLWPEMLRAIREISPSFVVGENVRGLTNWNGGMVFDEVCAELENLGYQVAPVIIPACGVGAPHRRERVWFIAYTSSNGGQKNPKSKREENEENTKQFKCIYNNGYASNAKRSGSLQRGENIQPTKPNGEKFKRVSWQQPIANSDSARQQTLDNKKPIMGKENRTKTFSRNGFKPFYSAKRWENFPTQSPICSGNDGLSKQLDGITFSKWRNESIKAYGNAIVPQVAYQIFKAIQLTNENTGH
jgi:DNA (cytosine-5)-methyltransferase 1